ncbi:ASCH domain-containing protein [Guptibacillus hwajinpoensis]|uniref:RNA-binding protein n=1 Tax=Guptibacillus hwajinpoensis TaxID=208199 RepID=A0A0J6D4D8_9BACL|nr:ASCH domain-containing protein [Alkalihalobacillus macyae]KMM39159.1 RNA-binding protein [Alkalihalobacillus macyae]
MNETAQNYWDHYWKGREKPPSVTAWQFGDDPDQLAKLVMKGIKTATCSAHIFYELDQEPLPTTQDYSVILNSQNEPVAIIKTVEVSTLPMNEVSEEFAAAEGEGDRSYEYWWNVHEAFFTSELKEVEREFSEDLLVVCERFELIDVK